MKLNLKSFLTFALMAPVLVFSQGCETTSPASQIQQMGFSHLEPIRLNVAKVEISSTYATPMKAPNIEHRFPTSPQRAAMKWALERLEAAGETGLARFIVLDASVVEVPMGKTKSGIVGAFTPEPTADYRATLKVRLEVGSADGMSEAQITANAQRNVLIHEDVSLAEREQIWFEMIETLMTDLDVAMEQRLRNDLGAWVAQ